VLRWFASIAAVVIVAATPPAIAHAEDVVVCPTNGKTCYVVVGTPGTPGRSGAGPVSDRQPGSGRAPLCSNRFIGDVSCFDSSFGWWSNADGCYYRRLDPQPASSDPAWEGHYGSGAIYSATCPLPPPGMGGGWVWRATPPPGLGGAGPTPAQLAAQAVSQLPLDGPVIGMAPGPGKTGLVGLPVWMWTEVSARTWGPVSATASVPGLSVTATARAVRIVWDMGDGATVTCDGPGTPYSRELGAAVSPTCGHRYGRSSAGQPGAEYTVTATTSWDVDWAGGGESGQLTQTRSSSTRVRIGELQVLVS